MKKYLLLLLVLCSCSEFTHTTDPTKGIWISSVKVIGGGLCEYTTLIEDKDGNAHFLRWQMKCGEYSAGEYIKICK